VRAPLISMTNLSLYADPPNLGNSRDATIQLKDKNSVSCVKRKPDSARGSGAGDAKESAQASARHEIAQSTTRAD
jgi:hypothetical protein